ncbi:hypothetical protein [Streptomyces xinghaiensis]|uniref:hypothetical protein n=1 Tax=Streptomyces xinghaiensis TaxID=1038928 RepID=UPI000309462A|nr:hypothetical protein [Streptomyces xinghaiensis]MZE80929.1 hypothetical protein [Streptomyces sp. SID5475]
MPEYHPDDATLRAAERRALEALTKLIRAAGPGSHLICAVAHEVGDTALRSVCPFSISRDDETGLTALEWCSEGLRDVHAVLCAAFGATPVTTACVLMRTITNTGTTVRGWLLRQNWLVPISEAEVFKAACTGLGGELVPPEYGVTYAAGVPLGPPPLT